jgi:hypothetical protein
VFVLSSLAVIADLAGLTAVFLSNLPLFVKIGIAVPLIGIPSACLLVHAGRRMEWSRLAPRIHDLEDEVQELSDELASPPSFRRVV